MGHPGAVIFTVASPGLVLEVSSLSLWSSRVVFVGTWVAWVRSERKLCASAPAAPTPMVSYPS